MGEWLARLRDWFRRDRLDAELSDELRFHRQRLERDAGSGGASAGAAASAARRQLGNTTRVIEDARDRWSLPWFDQLQQDVRYALRGLRRSPGFTLTVILTLGLGIGANAAMFGLIDRLMFRPFAFLREPAAVHRVYLRTDVQRWSKREIYPYARYLDLRKWTTSFSQYAAFTTNTLAVGTGDGSREMPVAGVSASFFGFFEARPVLGRFFGAAEDSLPTGSNVAILSYPFWNAAFGGRNVVGESILVGTMQCTIIGVAPQGFVGVAESSPPAVYVPITAYASNSGGGSRFDYYLAYNWDWTEILVRRKAGVSVAAATADLTNAFARSRTAMRALNPAGPQVERLHPRAIAGPVKTAAGPDPGLEARTLVWITGVAVIVLLIACANVANLFLARALRRRREVALRVALGVRRGRLLRQSLTESLVLSLMGCVAGLAIAQWGGLALRRLFVPDATPFDLVTDLRTLGMAAAAALVAGLLTGFAPVILASDVDLAGTLKAGVREGTFHRSRLRSSLLVLQGALSVVLLIGAGLFVQSLARVGAMRLGYNATPVLLARWERRGTPMNDSAQTILRGRLLEAARVIPGVEHAAWASSVPFEGTSTLALSVPGIDSVSRLGRFNYQTNSADYFATMGTRILRGRPFTEQDKAGTPTVAVVSEGMARVIWPGQEALGQCLRPAGFGVRPDTMPCTTVVGIAEDAVHDPAADQPYRYYLPLDQFPMWGGSNLLLRLRGDPAALAEGVRRALQKEMPGQSYMTVRPLRELVDVQRRSWRVGATMFVAFGVLALVVAAIGLYGVIAYTVTQRMHELGVRIALGAKGSDVIRLVVGHGVRFALAGVFAGSLLALLGARWIQPLLFQESAKDPSVFALVAIVLIVVALVASSAPAFRATHADPNTVLRAE